MQRWLNEKERDSHHKGLGLQENKDKDEQGQKEKNIETHMVHNDRESKVGQKLVSSVMPNVRSRFDFILPHGPDPGCKFPIIPGFEGPTAATQANGKDGLKAIDGDGHKEGCVGFHLHLCNECSICQGFGR